MSEESELYAIFVGNIESGLKKGKDLNTLLEPYRRYIPPHDYCEVETLEDAKRLIEQAIDRLLLYIKQTGK